MVASGRPNSSRFASLCNDSSRIECGHSHISQPVVGNTPSRQISLNRIGRSERVQVYVSVRGPFQPMCTCVLVIDAVHTGDHRIYDKNPTIWGKRLSHLPIYQFSKHKPSAGASAFASEVAGRAEADPSGATLATPQPHPCPRIGRGTTSALDCERCLPQASRSLRRISINFARL